MNDQTYIQIIVRVILRVVLARDYMYFLHVFTCHVCTINRTVYQQFKV